MYKAEVVGDGNIRVRVVEDSIANDTRLVTLELRFHRFILPEFNTHRVFSRNASSSRAIPVSKMIEQVKLNPAMPIHWGKNQKGMQAVEELTDYEKRVVKDYWRDAAFQMSKQADLMQNMGLHKQATNRLLEPFQFINVVMTATEWFNFFELRDHADAQPEIKELARVMKAVMDKSKPTLLSAGEWHLPYVSAEEVQEIGMENALKCSTARCARVSYVTFDMKPPTVENDLRLYDQLITSRPQHASPAEHQATPMKPFTFQRTNTTDPVTWEKGVTHMDKDYFLWSGNFRSWVQHRQLL
jgi:hypothetical protein